MNKMVSIDVLTSENLHSEGHRLRNSRDKEDDCIPAKFLKISGCAQLQALSILSHDSIL